MDALSHILALLRPLEVGWRLVEGHDGWTLHYPPRRDIVVFGYMLEGACEVRSEGAAPWAMAAGDFMLLTSPAPWSMRTPGDGPAVGMKELIDDPTLLRRGEAPGRVTRFVGGYFSFDPVGADLIARLAPPRVHVRAGAASASRLGALLSMLGEEAEAQRSGRSHVLERLLELMLIETLRAPGHGWSQADPGLLRALSDARLSKALERLHEDVARDWTVAELAAIAGMSRSAFALRFQDRVGLSPIAYLSQWRMALARQALAAGERSMTAVSLIAGYRSVSAFSTAFRRSTGVAPTRYLEAHPAG